MVESSQIIVYANMGTHIWLFYWPSKITQWLKTPLA